MSDDLSKKMKWLQDFEVVYGEETEEVEKTEFSSLLEENATKSFQLNPNQAEMLVTHQFLQKKHEHLQKPSQN